MQENILFESEVLNHYIRIEYEGIGIYVDPEFPDWFVPTRKADDILKEFASGNSLGCNLDRHDVNQLKFQMNRLLCRLSKPDNVQYQGRAEFLEIVSLKECWFHITNTCNLSCTHCMFSSGPSVRSEIPKEPLIDTIREAISLGCEVFYFTGGEPTIYKEFIDVCEFILDNSSAHIVILTNAVSMDHFICWIKNQKSGRIHLQISIDGIGSEHDTIRGKDSFSKTLENTKKMIDVDCNITLAMAVTKDNVSQMPDLIHLADDLHLSNVHYLWSFRKGNAETLAFPSIEMIKENLFKSKSLADQYGILIDNLEILKSQVFSLPGTKYDLSNSGWQSLAVGPEGNIYPSPALIGEGKLVAGHISEGLKSVWQNSELFKVLRKKSIVDSHRYKNNPLKYIIGGGDIDHSFVQSGNFLDHDPYVELYNTIALKLIIDQTVLNGEYEQTNIGLLGRMGEKIYECGEDTGKVMFTHSNCVLSLPGKDGHTLVKAFYSKAADTPNEEIFNPVQYAESDVSHIPRQARVRSYGCGSPVFDCDIEAGETVVDLGCGTGVECFIAARKVGPKGRVIGIDMAEAMLEVAEKSRQQVTDNLGFNTVEFKKAFLEDLPLNSDSVDAMVSNCVINLSPDKRRTFKEVYRVLRPGGRLVISDIAHKDDIPLEIKYNEKLRGECIGGAFKEEELFGLLSDIGFQGATILKRYLYRTIAGHDFYSITYRAWKPSDQLKQVLMYRGPFASVVTDDGVVLDRGKVREAEVSENYYYDKSVYILDEKGNVTNVEQKMTCSCFAAPEQNQISVKNEPKYSSGCVVCGKDLIYLEHDEKLTCYYCGHEQNANATCEDGHFVCDQCHSQDAVSIIEQICLHLNQTDMLKLMRQIRSHPSFPVHGPEHHSLVPAVIVTAYCNTAGKQKNEMVKTAVERGRTIAGGACAFLGVCGAAVGAGTAFSILLNANPYKGRERQVVQEVTALVLKRIAQNKAARCCQRDCAIGLQAAADLSSRYLDITLKAKDELKCRQKKDNAECMGKNCLLW